MEIFDADKLIGEPRKMILGGREFDTTILPARTSVLAFMHKDAIERFARYEFDEADLDVVFKILLSALKPKHPDVTQQWLEANVSAHCFGEIMTHVMRPALKAATKVEEDQKKSGDSHTETSS